MFKQGRNVLLLGAVLILAVAAARFAYRLPGTLEAIEAGPTRESVADLNVQPLAGEPVLLRDLRGQVVLVNFWATWCSGCRSEMPGFQAVYDEHKDRGFTILALSIDETGPGTVESFLRENGYDFPVAMATTDAKRRFGTTGVPTSFLIDREGEIRHAIRGVLHEADLREAVQKLLAGTPADE